MAGDWREGKPDECGYYLAAYRIHPGHPPTVSELWFNANGTWWASRGYLEGFGQRNLRFNTQPINTVSHWMPIPEPPLEAWREKK